MAAHCSRERSVCVPAESFYLTRIARFIETAHPWKTGVPSDPSNDSGALIRKEHLQKNKPCKPSPDEADEAGTPDGIQEVKPTGSSLMLQEILRIQAESFGIFLLISNSL
ncbi:uncharacterized protein LOC127944580 isoform X1 [Carassius gibelio]|uniref:uncharacterized protein LOC127944580 isoform X1 n=1 Tax=Carassius gibelio TaxID=101364 RepID=UPI002277935F|nr:uncharacterized protein LOC127944580 isoform X1 [Carassius gibelio]